MKKFSLFAVCILAFIGVFCQPTMLYNIDFSNGYNGWTPSGNYSLYSNADEVLDGACLRLIPTSNQSATFVSPVINIDANKNVRLEFNSVPMVPNAAGGVVYIIVNGTEIPLNQPSPRDPPQCYDATYGGGMTSSFMGKFYRNCYWKYLNTYNLNITQKYWKHEVFYLSGSLNGATSFQIKFAVPNDLVNTGCRGWWLDDIKVFEAAAAGNEVRIPQIKERISYPNIAQYPNCGDAVINFRLQDANGALSSIPDSIYVEYYSPNEIEHHRVNFQNTSGQYYTAVIPFAGVDSTIYWRAVINDQMGNVTTYPFTGKFHKFKFIKPYVGKEFFGNPTSSQSVLFNTSVQKALYQMRYPASELLAAGYKPGKINGMWVNIASAPSSTILLSNFKMDVGLIDSEYPFTHAQDIGPYTFSPLTNVVNQVQYTLPPVGEQFIAFDQDITWDGESDILIKVCYEGVSPTGTTRLLTTPTANGESYQTYRFEAASSMTTACTSPFTVGDPAVNYKPYIGFNFVNFCYFAKDAGIRTDTIVHNATNCDSIIPTSVVCQAGSPTTLGVFLRNDGTDTLYKVLVKWMVDDNANTIDSALWSGVMRPIDNNMHVVDSAVRFNATTNFLPEAGVHTLKVWTEMPRDWSSSNPDTTIDWNFENDTAVYTLIVKSGMMNGTYAIGNVAGVQSTRTYRSLDDAFLMLTNSGVNGPCTFKIAAGEYNGFWKFPSCVSGVSATNNITFTSASSDSIATFVNTIDSYIFDLTAVAYMNFKNLGFKLGNGLSNVMNGMDMIKLGPTSSNLSFNSCKFYNAGQNLRKVNSILSLSAANNISVDSCIFNLPASNQIHSEGLSPITPTNNLKIKNNTFNILGDILSTTNGASVYTRYSNNAVIENNTFRTMFAQGVDSIQNATKYAILVNNSSNAKISKNVFILKSFSGISLSNITNSTIANNRISTWFANSAAAQFSSYGINMLEGSNNKIVYNNIFGRGLSSASKKVYCMNLGYQGLVSNSNVVKNNIIYNDGYGYAAAVRPTDSLSFKVSNNFYYKTSSIPGTILFSVDGSSTSSVADWQAATGDTLSSYFIDPIFYAWDNLLTTNTSLCEAGTSISGVTEDCFGNTRPTTYNPCIGSHEFEPPTSNIYVIETGTTSGNFDGINTYTSCEFHNDSVFVRFSNISNNTIPANSLKFKFSVGSYTSPQIPFAPQVIPDSVYYVVFPTTYNFEAVNGPITHHLKTWSVLAADTVNNNDTARAVIQALYQIPTQAPTNVNVPYASTATVNKSSTDSVYWYYSADADTFFYKGHSFTTAPLYADTTFYYSLKSEIAKLRISEIQFSKAATKTGQTNPLPEYINKDYAYEISNFGNGDINLSGYSFVYHKGNNSGTINNTATATYSFPEGYVLKANKSVVLMATTSTLAVGDSLCLAIPTQFNGEYNNNFLLGIKDNSGAFVDAVVYGNNATLSGITIPSTVWQSGSKIGSGTNNDAGIKRTNSDGHNSSAWMIATDENRMTMGTYDNGLTLLTDNGCYGFKSQYNIHLTNIPNYDPSVIDVKVVGLQDTSACNLGAMNISATIANTGIQNLTNIPIVCNIYENNTVIQTIRDTVSTPLLPMDTTTIILPSTVDFTANTVDRNIKIEAVVNYAGDIYNNNDTNSINIVSLNTPLMPIVSDDSIAYGASATLIPTASSTVIWYIDPTSNVELARGPYTTPTLYSTDTFYAASLVDYERNIVIGIDSSVVLTSGASAHPSPFNLIMKHVKEQYLIPADTLLAYGYAAGQIRSLSFKVQKVTGTSTANLTDYTVKVGNSTSSALSTWESELTTVYSGSQSFSATTTAFWRTITFDNPYYWDGNSNVVIEISYASSSTTNKIITYTTPTDYASTLSYRNNTNDALTYTGSPTSTYQKIPYMKVGMSIIGCTSERRPVVVTVAPPPSCDAALTEIVSPQGSAIMSAVPIPIKVVLKNYGTDALTSLAINWSINDVAQTPYTYTGNLSTGTTDTVTLDNHSFASGAIEIVAAINLSCDTIKNNDTVRANYSACVGNNTTTSTFSIGPSGNYATITDAINALEESGICGPVVFDIPSGTYTTQISIPNIIGTSTENTITFRGSSNGVTKIKNPSSASDKTVLILSGAENIYFENLTFEASSANNENVVRLSATNDIHFTNVKFSAPSSTTSQIILANLEDTNANTYFINDEFIGGGYCLQTSSLSNGASNNGLTVQSCFFNNFLLNATNINTYNNILFRKNYFRAFANNQTSSAAYFNGIGGQSTIQSNRFYLTETTKNRTALEIKNCAMTDMYPLIVANNEISMWGNKSVNTYGIDVDSSTYVFFYYNSILIQNGSNNTKVRCMNVGRNCQNVMTRNNNLENRSKGYSYYVDVTATGYQVTLSDNNNYVSNSTGTSGKLAFWGVNASTIESLRTANNMDANSMSVENSFVSDSCLSLTYPTAIVRSAEFIEDVIMDIQDSIRPQTPSPTIGAYEYHFTDVDCGAIAILNPDPTIDYPELDTIMLSVTLKNFGNYSLDTINVVAELKGHLNDAIPMQTLNEQYIGFLGSLGSTTYNFTNPLVPQLNNPLSDSLYLIVYTTNNNDTTHINDTTIIQIKCIPAKDLTVVATRPQEAGIAKCGANMRHQAIATTIKNSGCKTITAADTVFVTYEIFGQSGIMLASSTEQLQFPYSADGQVYQNLQPSAQLQYFTFTNTVDLYPQGLNDTNWRVRTYITFASDHVKNNDTSAYVTYLSKVSPPAPIMQNDTIYYGTWGHPSGTQSNRYALKWFNDTNDVDPFYSPTNYNASTTYTTDTLFNDVRYYVMVTSTGNVPCPSDFSPVDVIIRPRCDVDIAALGVAAPARLYDDAPYTHVYEYEDTVKVNIINYSSTPQTNFSISYAYKPTTPANAPWDTVTELFTQTLNPDIYYTYTFNQLANFQNKVCTIKAWVKAEGDCTTVNDTTASLSVIPATSISSQRTVIVNDPASLDITRVQLSNIDNSSIAGNDSYSDYSDIDNPIIMFKGVGDTLYVTNAPSSSADIEEGAELQGWMKVFMDWNRNGWFEYDSTSLTVEGPYSDTVHQSSTNKIYVMPPANVHSGLLKMRIILAQNDIDHKFGAYITKFEPSVNDGSKLKGGEVEDYLIRVLPAEQNNADLTRFTAPERLTSEQTQDIKIRLHNAGLQPLTNATIRLLWQGHDDITYNWNGNLASGSAEEVTVAHLTLDLGNNYLTAIVDAPNDTYHANDTIKTNAYIFHKYRLYDEYVANFDTSAMDDFYAYEENSEKPTNCWQFGVINADSNNIINAPYSAPNCWKTNLNGKFPKNNLSVLYSPVFDVSEIKPDTMSFYAKINLGSANVVVEYLNYANNWVRLGGDEEDTNHYDDNWYHTENGFQGNSGYYKQMIYSLNHLTADMGLNFQVRFIFTSGNGANAEGMAIDNFTIKRGRRDNDIGVTSIELMGIDSETGDTVAQHLPYYGRYFYPKVKVENFGNLEISSFTVCYRSQDMYIPQCEDVFDANLRPDSTMDYIFRNGRYLNFSMPDPFILESFTRMSPADIYFDNDSAYISCVIGPLRNDAAMMSIEEPASQVASNDEVQVSVKVKNYGLYPINDLLVSYSYYGGRTITENIHFNPPLLNSEEYIYTFAHKFTTSFGVVNVKAWVSLEGDEYHNNDTTYKYVEGTNATTDIQARQITLDDASTGDMSVQFTFFNASNRGTDNITVGYYYNNDPTTAVEELYYEGQRLEAGAFGYHVFAVPLPRTLYQSVCAYVKVDGDAYPSNDTTCAVYLGYRDGVIDSIMVEETDSSTVKLQIRAHNGGSLGGRATMVTGKIVVNGDYSNPIAQTFTWNYDEPRADRIQYMTFDTRIPRSNNHQYNLVAWIEYPDDINRSNDTTSYYKIQTFVNLDSVMDKEEEFILYQNVPNPFRQHTTIDFNIPSSGEIHFYITNNMGQIVYQYRDHYSEGRHAITFDESLPQGMYYYILEYNGKRRFKKMVVVQ